ncbi:kinetochore complex Sim4 subunit Fta1-domain-containing protein [Daldinia sp. FL1419]|nr:kinetochore complex Sim4 subunit Fta1-domain-containing protein [Daldinia sp. FL1419]
MPPRKRKNEEAEEPPAGPASPSPLPSPSPPSSPGPGPGPGPGSDAEPASPTSPSADLSHDDSEPPRFLNTTFTTYRVSPLYVGKQGLTPARLQLLSKRLRDTLVGDVVRGVQVGLDSDTVLGRTGALYAVDWRWIDAERILGEGSRRQGSVELGNVAHETDEGVQGGKQQILSVELRYENARFSALLLSDLSIDENVSDDVHHSSWTWQSDDNGSSKLREEGRAAFLHLPLLLFRMPAPLKSVLVEFLSSTFDCRISPLALGTQTLVSSWEAWLSDNHSKGNARVSGKNVLITLGFHIEPYESKLQDNGNEPSSINEQEQDQKQDQPPLAVKAIDVAIPAADTYRFLRVGEKLGRGSAAAIVRKRKPNASTTLSDDQQRERRRKLAGGKDEEGWAWRKQYQGNTEREEKVIEQPFTDALAAYMWHHFGLDMFHPGVRVQRVACEGFALSEGRLKVFAPSRGYSSDEEGQESSAWKLVRGLVRRARVTSNWTFEAASKMTVQR